MEKQLTSRLESCNNHFVSLLLLRHVNGLLLCGVSGGGRMDEGDGYNGKSDVRLTLCGSGEKPRLWTNLKSYEFQGGKSA